MRIGIVGGGVAGSLLAWRLVTGAWPGDVELMTGPAGGRDATSASGGLVRAFELDAHACVLAAHSLAELRASSTLRAWADYQEVGSTYYCRPEQAGVIPDRLRAVEAVLGGSASVVPARAAPAGLAGFGDGALAVVERHAGHYSPGSLRARTVLDFRARGGRVVHGAVRRIVPEPGGGARCVFGGWQHRRYDVLVVAAGPWTPGLLAASGLPSAAYRTKLIQYGLYRVEGPRPGAFVDETTGLYGRPAGTGLLLLGVPSTAWDVQPRESRPRPLLHEEVVRAARSRLPALELRSRERTIVSCDAYARGGLALRSVLSPAQRLYTYTGGSGGAAKVALAASRRAARELVDQTALLRAGSRR